LTTFSDDAATFCDPNDGSEYRFVKAFDKFETFCRKIVKVFDIIVKAFDDFVTFCRKIVKAFDKFETFCGSIWTIVQVKSTILTESEAFLYHFDPFCDALGGSRRFFGGCPFHRAMHPCGG